MFSCCGSGRKAKTKDDFLTAATDFAPKAERSWTATISSQPPPRSPDELDHQRSRPGSAGSGTSRRSRSQDNSDRAENVQRLKPEAQATPPPYFQVVSNEGSQGRGPPLPNDAMNHPEEMVADRMAERVYDDTKSQRPNWIDRVAGSQFQGSVAGGRDTFAGSDTDSLGPGGIRPGSRDFVSCFHTGINVHPPISAETSESFAIPGRWPGRKQGQSESVISKRPRWLREQAPSELSQQSHWKEGQSALGAPSSDEDEEKKTSPAITPRGSAVTAAATRLSPPNTLLENGGSQLPAHVGRIGQTRDAQLEPSPTWTDEVHSLDADGGSEAPDDRVYRLTTQEPSAAVAVQGGQESSPAKTMGGQSSAEVCPRPPSEVGDSGTEQLKDPPRKANKVSAARKGEGGYDHTDTDDSLVMLINELRRRNEKLPDRPPSPGQSKRNRGGHHGSSPSASQSTHEDPVEGSPGKGTFRSISSTQSRVIPSQEKVPLAFTVPTPISSSVEAPPNNGRSTTPAGTSTPISKTKLGTFSFPPSPEHDRKRLNKRSGVSHGGEGASVAVQSRKSPPVRGISPSSGPENGGFADAGGTGTDRRHRDSSGTPNETRSRMPREHSGSGRDSGTEGGGGDGGGDKSERQTRRRDRLPRPSVPAKPEVPPLDGSPPSALALRVESSGLRRPPGNTSADDSRGVNHVGVGGRLARDGTSSNDNRQHPKDSRSPFKRARPSEGGDQPGPTESEKLIRDANNGRKSGSAPSRERPQHVPIEITATTSSSQTIVSPLDVRAGDKSLCQEGSMESTSSSRSSQGPKSIISSSTTSSSGSSQTKNSRVSKVTSSSKNRRSHIPPSRQHSPVTGQSAQSTGSSTGSERDGEPIGNTSRPPPAPRDLSGVSSLGKPITSKPIRRKVQTFGTPSQRGPGRVRPPTKGNLPSVEEACEDSGPSPRRKLPSLPPDRNGEPAMQKPKPRKRLDSGPLSRSITINVPPSYESRSAGTAKTIDSALSSEAPVVARSAIPHPLMPRETPSRSPVETDDGKVEALAWLNERRKMLRLREDLKLFRRKSSSRLSRSSSFDEGSMRSFQSRGLPMFSPERFNAGAGALSWGAGSYDDSWCTATESVYSGNTRESSCRSTMSAGAFSNRGKLMHQQLSQREKQSVDRLKINRSDVHFGYRPVRGKGSVYKAELNGEIRAAKVISLLHMSKDSVADVMEVFDAELLLLSQLNSPNIVKVFGASVSPVQLIVVSEFVEGGTLRDLLENPVHRNTLRQKTKLSIALGIAAGMRSLYAHGMQHRRLSSHAVLLTHDWQPKISGAGLLITKEMVAYASDEEPDPDVGLLWVSREVLAGAGFGEESDVYSFGIVLWEIMQSDGSLPYAGLSTEQVVSVKYSGQGPPISPNCPRPLSRLMQGCWSNIPADRPSFSKICDVLDPAGTATHSKLHHGTRTVGLKL